MIEFENAIRAHGLRPKRAVVADGKWGRCPTDDHPKKDNGAYKLMPDGGVGWYWNLATDSAPITWRPDRESADVAPRSIDLEEVQRRREAEQEAYSRATAAAGAFYDACAPLRGGHPYLEAHGLDMAGCSGLRSDRDGWMVVPAYRFGRLTSLQRISPEGEKRFWTGAPMSGVSYTVDRHQASITVLCEGLATGLAIFAAAPLTRVVVAFTSGNLKRVAEKLPYKGMVCVAADNDHRTAERIGKNPGVVAADEAAAILGCGVMVPEGITGTDWCDWRNERVARRMEKPVYGRRETENSIRRATDAEVAMAVTRNSRLRMERAG